MTDEQAQIAESAFVAFSALADVLNALVAFTVGHRAECLQAGFSETASEQMAVAAHSMGLALILKAQT